MKTSLFLHLSRTDIYQIIEFFLSILYRSLLKGLFIYHSPGCIFASVDLIYSTDIFKGCFLVMSFISTLATVTNQILEISSSLYTKGFY